MGKTLTGKTTAVYSVFKTIYLDCCNVIVEMPNLVQFVFNICCIYRLEVCA